MSRHRVVVTGMGVVTPLGNTVRGFTDRLLAGCSGVGPVTHFDPAEFPVRIAAEVKQPMPERFRDRKISFAFEATRQAVADAACGDPINIRSEESGVCMGIGLEVLDLDDLITLQHHPGIVRDLKHQRRLSFLQTPSDLCVHALAQRYQLAFPPRVCVSACAAGTDAIGCAFQMIRSGRVRRVLCGGTDSMINPLGLGGFCKLRALSGCNESPAEASRPFDADRDGFVLGEGAGMLVLERMADAHSRQATVHAEIVGYGSSLDAYGISEPHPEGRGALQAMQRALQDAEQDAAVIDCINAHGSSTPKNDKMETLAIRRLLGNRADQVPVVSTKSMIGHLISAAGAVEAIAAITCLQRNQLHPTINQTRSDPDCDLDYVPNFARNHLQNYVLSNSFGFGGQNASLLIRRT